VVREHVALLAPGTAYLVSARAGAATMSHEELTDAVERLLSPGEGS
jgi:hypothetical protein